jgi:uncharacterized protein (DUF1697 family)
MNYIISVFALVAVIATNPVRSEEHETKKVCVDVMKDGKPVKDAKGVVKQTCKTVKEHKKLEVAK